MELHHRIAIWPLLAAVASMSASVFGQDSTGATVEPTITGAKIQNRNAVVGTAVTIYIEFNTKEVPKPWCGFEINWGDGDSQDVRAGHDGADRFPLQLSHIYRTPGQFNLRISGKYLSRGFLSANACAGGTKQTLVTVTDPAEEKATRDAERFKEETDRKARELEVKEAALRRLAEKLELVRKVQEEKEQKLKAQQRANESKPTPSRPNPNASPAPQANSPKKPVVDPF
jgi:hypothetical protein